MVRIGHERRIKMEEHRMDDLISRTMALDAVNHICPVDTEYDCTLLDRVDVRCVLLDLPSAERKKGRWVKDGEAYALYKCSACNNLCTVAGWANCVPEEQMYKGFKFCPNCGAEMENSDEQIR